MPQTLYQQILQGIVGTQQLPLRGFYPPVQEGTVSGSIDGRISRSSDPNSRFQRELIRSDAKLLVFESDDARYMTARLEEALVRIAQVIYTQSGNQDKLRVLLAWAPAGTSGLSTSSLHYEGRAAAIVCEGSSVSVGELSSIAISTGLATWVLRENGPHGEQIHVSVPQVST